MTTAALTCREFVELVTEYLEGKLSLSEKARFDQHLAVCSYCRIYLEQMQQTLKITGKLSEEQVPVEARDELLAAFRGWKTARKDSD
jgi:predicted anti-sigma-YlaC factor YlaD